VHIEHIALWTRDLERLRHFYELYFNARAGARYRSARRPFESYFLSFPSGSRLEIMKLPDLADAHRGPDAVGLAHLAIATGSRENVLALTERLRTDGYTIAGEPRTTGDGYFESAVLDPDGNPIELTI
jgi:lactoylglutathione lyase